MKSDFLDVYMEDSDMKYFSQRIKVEEKRVRQLLADIKDFILNPKHTKDLVESFKKGAAAGQSPTKGELDDFRKACMSSLDQLSKQTPKQVPIMWKLLGRDIATKVGEIIEINNKTLPELRGKFTARREVLTRNIQKTKSIANKTSSVALLRNTKLHPVWSVVASKVK